MGVIELRKNRSEKKKDIVRSTPPKSTGRDIYKRGRERGKVGEGVWGGRW